MDERCGCSKQMIYTILHVEIFPASMKYVEDIMGNKDNILSNRINGMNYNASMLRFVAALMVIVSHAFALTTEGDDWLMAITDGQMTMGGFAVSVFFAFSGFYVTRSIKKFKGSMRSFMWARIKRLLPSLALVIAVLTFVIGPIMTDLSVSEYFRSFGTYKFLANAVFVPIHELPGVFANNEVLHTVNGALWTLPVEVLCYISLVVVHELKLLEKKRGGILAVLVGLGVTVIAFVAKYTGVEILASMVAPITCFYVGAVLYIYSDAVSVDWKKICFSILIMVVATFCGVLGYVASVALPCVVLLLIYSGDYMPKSVKLLGDISYEMYLVGFPIQQAIISLFGGNMNPYLNMVIAIPIDIVIGYLIYKIVNHKK